MHDVHIIIQFLLCFIYFYSVEGVFKVFLFEERDKGTKAPCCIFNMSAFVFSIVFLNALSLFNSLFKAVFVRAPMELKQLNSDPVWVFSLQGKPLFISDLLNLEERLLWVWIHSFYKYIHLQSLTSGFLCRTS